MKVPEQTKAFSCLNNQVIRILLEYVLKRDSSRSKITQREMAVMLNTDWMTIHTSLKSLCDEGLIRIENNRIIINNSLCSALLPL
jgi:DNA-binding GntR family transcriptional regulator